MGGEVRGEARASDILIIYRNSPGHVRPPFPPAPVPPSKISEIKHDKFFSFPRILYPLAQRKRHKYSIPQSSVYLVCIQDFVSLPYFHMLTL